MGIYIDVSATYHYAAIGHIPVSRENALVVIW